MCLKACRSSWEKITGREASTTGREASSGEFPIEWQGGILRQREGRGMKLGGRSMREDGSGLGGVCGKQQRLLLDPIPPPKLQSPT